MVVTTRRAPIRLGLAAFLAAAVAGCGSGAEDAVDPAATVVTLPGAADQIDFDDISYSARLRELLVPAGDSGLYVVDPDTSAASKLSLTPMAGGSSAGSVDSVDEGRGLVFVADRSNQQIAVVSPDSGRVVSTVAATGPPDYLRYVPLTGQVWVTEPATSSVEIFAVAADALRRVDSVGVPDGPEGIAVSAVRRSVFTHAGDDLVGIDLRTHALTRWPTGCTGTHGFPRVDDRDGLVLASCAQGGEVSLLDLTDGHRLGEYAVGGGESLPAYSSATGHFFVRSDPGTKLATLTGDRTGLHLVREVDVPEVGHCLGADDTGRYWTCDADRGRILGFDDVVRSTS